MTEDHDDVDRSAVEHARRVRIAAGCAASVTDAEMVSLLQGALVSRCREAVRSPRGVKI
jgi:hypothetical protein